MTRRTALLLLLALAGCGSSSAVDRTGGGNAGGAPDYQASNGPLTIPDHPSPLAVHVEVPADPVHLRFHQPPRSGLLFDLDTGKVLWRRNPSLVVPIASLTKMMTALVVVAHESAHARVLVTKQALAYTGSGVGLLPKGKRIQLETMLYGLLLPSGNDAAIALSQRVAGTQKQFIAMMNARARGMSLACTHYSTVSGIIDAHNHSCAIDLAAESRAILDSPRLARIVGTASIERPFPIKGGKLYLFNNNPLLRMHYPGTIGIKTGFTDAAGRCLVAAVRRGSRRLGIVLLHSPDPGDQAVKLFNAGFALGRGA